MNKPDKIWVDYTPYTETYQYVTVYNPHDGSTGYLLATPEREIASELVEALQKWVELADRTLNDHITRLDANRAADFSQGVRETCAVLAKLDKG